MTQHCIIPLARLLQPLAYSGYSNLKHTYWSCRMSAAAQCCNKINHPCKVCLKIDMNTSSQQKEDDLLILLPPALICKLSCFRLG